VRGEIGVGLVCGRKSGVTGSCEYTAAAIKIQNPPISTIADGFMYSIRRNRLLWITAPGEYYRAMNEEHSGGDYSHKKELDQLEQKLVDLKGELAQAFEGTRGRSNGEIEEEIRQIEEKILEIEAQEDL
jgi:hypothetical protein